MTPVARAVRDRVRAVPPLVADGLLAAAVLGLDLGQRAVVIGDTPAAAPGSDALGYALIAGFTLPLVLRRRFPRAVLATIIALMTAYVVAGYTLTGTGTALLIASYTAGSRADLRASLPAHALFAVMVTVGVATARVEVAPVEVVAVVVVYAAAWWLGANMRARRRDAAELALRAAQLEHARQELAEHAVAEERLRIARELHDVVAHSMSVIAVQSGVGAHVIDSQPEAARQALAHITTISRAALGEMRRLLGVLRQQGEANASLMPPVGLADVEALARSLRQAGLSVTVRALGQERPAPPAVDLSAYRIVQEALTNVLKHAPGAAATVTIGYGRDEVTLKICDDGARGAAAGRSLTANGGNGVVGMRERTALFGGEFAAGPLAGGGFQIRARLPYTKSLR